MENVTSGQCEYNISQINESCWCPQCAKYLRKCKEILSGDFKVIGGLFSNKIVVKCHCKGHIFEIQTARKTCNLKELKCRQRIKDKKAEHKRIEEERKKEQDRIDAEEQKKIFDECEKEQREKQVRE